MNPYVLRVAWRLTVRLYREGKLTVRERGGRKRAIGTRVPIFVPLAANDRSSLDFVSDQSADGRRFCVLTVLDDCTKERLGLVADTSLSGPRVAGELDQIIENHGKPKMIVSDNGSEFISNAILRWTDRVNVVRITLRLVSQSRTPPAKASMVGWATTS